MTSCNCKPSSNSCECGNKLPTPGNGLSLAIASIPMQPWETPCEPSVGFCEGTIFPGLNLPFYKTGGAKNA